MNRPSVSQLLALASAVAFVLLPAPATALGNNGDKKTTEQESPSAKLSEPVSAPTVLIGFTDEQAAGLAKSLAYGANSPELLAGKRGARFRAIGDYHKAIEAYKEAAAHDETDGIYNRHSYYFTITDLYEDKLSDYGNAYLYFRKYVDATRIERVRNSRRTQERLIYLELASNNRHYEAVEHAKLAMEAELAWWGVTPETMKKNSNKRARAQWIHEEWQPRIAALEQRARDAGQLP